MNAVGAASYSAGALAFATLAVLLMTLWRSRLQGGWLLAATVASAAWCGLLAFYSWFGISLLGPLFLAEVARDALWLVFLAGLISPLGGKGPTQLRVFVHLLWISVIFAGVLSGVFSRYGSVTESAGAPLVTYIMGSFLMALTGLVLVEQVFRNSNTDQRWAIKYLCLGIGGLFLYDLYLFANGTLFSRLDLAVWNARGAINALIVPLLAIAIARNPQLSSNVFISRTMVFFTSSLMAVGFYLLAMAAGGYYVVIYGGEWGGVIQAVFLFGALLVLAMVLFSGQLRATLRVFVSKHFFDYKYDYREEWLRLTKSLAESENGASLHENAIIAMARIVESPGGLIWRLETEEGLLPLTAWNMSPPTTAVATHDREFVNFIEQREWVVDVSEHARNPALYDHIGLPHWLTSLRSAWLVVPLMRNKRLWGIAVLQEPRAAQELTWEDRDLLKTAGRQVTGYLALEEAAQELSEGRQFQAFNQLTAFIMHDLKNLIAQQSLVVKNAARHKDNPAFIEDAIATVDNSVQRMSRLLEQLQSGGAQGLLRRVPLASLVQEVIEQCRQRGPHPELVVDCGTDALVVRVGRERFVMVLGHVVRNAQDAASQSGSVRIRLGREEAFAVLEVIDDGCGMSDEFIRNRLFRPFDSTKGSKGMGIGAHQTRQFVREAGGDVEVESNEGAGTVFRIRLPLAEPTGPTLAANTEHAAQG